MTLAERRAARVYLAGLWGAHFIHMRDALDQIDADEKGRKDDEGLMRLAMEAILLAQDNTLPMCRRWETFAEALDALRARLGEPAPEEPKP